MRLAEFTALYADKTIIPWPFDAVHHDAEIFADELVATIWTLIILEPLLDAGIVEFARGEVPLCHECLSTVIAQEKELHDALHEVMGMLADDYLRQTRFSLDSNRVMDLSSR